MFSGRKASSAREPDDAGFAQATLEFLDSLYGTALRLTRNADRAQDLVQDTYLKAIRAEGRFAAGTNLKAWLYTILHNTWRNRQRTGARARVEIDSEVVERTAESGGLDRGRQETRSRLLMRDSLNVRSAGGPRRVAGTFREVVWLRDVDELTYPGDRRSVANPIGR